MKRHHSPRGKFLAACLLAFLTVAVIGLISDNRLRQSTTFEGVPVGFASSHASPGESPKRPFVKMERIPAGVVPAAVVRGDLPAGMISEKAVSEDASTDVSHLARGLVMAGATFTERAVEAVVGKKN